MALVAPALALLATEVAVEMVETETRVVPLLAIPAPAVQVVQAVLAARASLLKVVAVAAEEGPVEPVGKVLPLT